MPITGTPANLSNLAKGSLATKIFAAQTSGITVTADAYTTASGTKYGQFPTGNSILKLTSTTQSNVTKVEFMGVESATQTGSAVTLGTCIRDLDWEDGSDFTSQSDGLAFPAGTTVELVWTVQHAENTPFKNNANTFTGAQTFSGAVTAEGMVTLTGGLRVPVFADTTARDAFYTAPENGDKAYVTGVGDQTYSAGDWVTINATATDLATEAAAGTVEIGTEAQVDTETDTGETGAFLVARPSHIVSQNNLASTDEGLGSALVGHEGGTTVKAKLDGIDTSLTTISQTTLTAGETITGATLPVPVVQLAADGELYKCDGNDTAKMAFIGFAVSNSTDGQPIQFQGAGVVGGFSGLTVGAEYYVQDAAGTIGTTPSTTMPIRVGIAVSATQIFIMRGERSNIVSTTRSMVAASGDVTIAHGLGVKPTNILVFAKAAYGGSTNYIPISSDGFYNGAKQGCSYFSTQSVGSNPYPPLMAAGTSNSVCVYMRMRQGTVSDYYAIQSGVAAMDATNVTITFTFAQAGSYDPSSTMVLTVIAFAD
jgi:transcription elongation GreA/GreB family factor